MASIAAESVAPPPAGFSNLEYQAGVVGQPFRIREAAGTGTYADIRQRPAGRGNATDGRGQSASAAATAAPAGAAAGGGRGGGEGGLTVQGLSIVKPPYGALAAIDLEKGVVKWRTPHGDTPDNVRSHPLLKGMAIPKTGQNGSVGLVITKTLVVLGDPQFTTTGEHPRGAMLRGYDKLTGKEVGAVFMPAPQSGSPMTYMLNGTQYIVVAVSGGPYSGEYIAFSLPPDALGK
jgi:quinoprotein glucose dehydrogenase